MLTLWEKPLAELDGEEWERLCDGCGRCCLVKLEDEESGEIAFTFVACRYLDPERCRCTVYEERAERKPGCHAIDRNDPEHFRWLPPTCAYRLRFAGRPLPAWHPLLTGDPDSVRRAGVSVAGQTLGELELGDRELEDCIVDWSFDA